MNVGFSLLPPAAGLCQECARDHPPGDPHDADSLYYQYWFFARHGRTPTWRDAISHCEPQVRQMWEMELRRLGVWDR